MKRLLNYTQEMGESGQSEFNRLLPMLQAVYFEAAAYCYVCFGKSLLITSIKRVTGVHGAWRGIDVDVCSGMVYEGGLLPSEAESIALYINSLFQYDPARPEMYCCFYGWRDPNGKHDNHIHFQVHPRTIPLDPFANSA